MSKCSARSGWIVILSLTSLLFTAVMFSSPDACANGVQRLERVYGIDISLDPGRARRTVGGIGVTKATPYQVGLMVPLLERFLKCYEPTLLKRNLRKIFLVGTVSIGGVQVGATYSLDHGAVVLAAWEEFTYFAHHEFSSLLMHVYPVNKRLWRSYNGAPYTHQTEYRRMKKSRRLRRLGFYYDYSQVSFEEDFNVLAGMALAKPRATAAEAKKYPRIDGKLHIIRKYYKDFFLCSAHKGDGRASD